MLRLDTPGGHALDLRAEGDALRINVPSWSEARAIIPGSFGERTRTLRLLADLFSGFGLTLSLESAGQSILRLGGNTKPSWVARLLRLGPTHVPLSALKYLLRRSAV